MDLIAAVTVRPADLLGLPCGRLAPGAPADLVLCDLNAPVVVDPDVLKSRSRNTPFDGRRLQGAVQGTFVAGRSVFRS
jgi:dihydroorotase